MALQSTIIHIHIFLWDLRDSPETPGRCREDYDKGTSAFNIISSRWNNQTIFALPLPVASCFCWKCLLEKKKVKFLVVYMSTLALHASPCCAWDVCPRVASNPAWILMGTIWKGSFILWQYVTAESITKQISETEIIKCSPCNQVTHTHSLLKGLCWVQNFVLISLLLSLPVFKEVIFRSKILSKD